MGAFYDEIPANVIDWIKQQKIFFVATAPLTDGRINVSPKEMEGLFEIVNQNTVWYQDLTGSGIETIAHINEDGNGRMTIMFVAFDGPPRIVRLFGKGRSYERTTDGFKKYLPDGDSRIKPGARAIVELDIEKVGTSCGYSIPYFDYVKPRTALDEYARRKMEKDLLSPGAEYTDDDLLSADVAAGGLREYWATKNAESVHNGLKALDVLVKPGADVKRQEQVKPPKSKRNLKTNKADKVDKAGGEPAEGNPNLPAWANMAIRGKPKRSSGDDMKLLVSCMVLSLVIGMSLGDQWTKFVGWAATKGNY